MFLSSWYINRCNI